MGLRTLKVIAITAALSVAGCASRSASKATVRATPSPAESYPVITRIVSRHQTVTISAGPTSPLYSVQSPDGRMLVAYATLDQLRQQHPDQFRMIEPLVAADLTVISSASTAE